jgi:hypothetical protein
MDGTFGAGTEGKWIGVGAGIARCGADGWMEGVGGGLMDAEILIAGPGLAAREFALGALRFLGNLDLLGFVAAAFLSTTLPARLRRSCHVYF